MPLYLFSYLQLDSCKHHCCHPPNVSHSHCFVIIVVIIIIIVAIVIMMMIPRQEAEEEEAEANLGRPSFCALLPEKGPCLRTMRRCILILKL